MNTVRLLIPKLSDMEPQRQEERADSTSLADAVSVSLETARPQRDALSSSALQDEVARRGINTGDKTAWVRSWKEFYEEDVNTAQSPEEAKLIFESKALLKAWSSEVDDEKNLRLSQLFPPNAKVFVADLKSLIVGLKDKQKPQGKAHRYLDNICNTLDSHSAMISMLPDQSIYASIFCGVFKTLVSASINHRSIIEALSRGLRDAGDIVHSCVQRATLVNIDEMRRLAQRLYTTVFTLMRQALIWYEDRRVKRLLNSFNDKYLEPFNSTLDDMRKIADLINAKAVMAHHAETRDTRLMLEDMKAWQQQVRDENIKLWERAYEKIDDQNKVLHEIPNRQLLGNFISNLLLETATEIGPGLPMYHANRPSISQEHIQLPQLHAQQRHINSMEGVFTISSGGRGSQLTTAPKLKTCFKSDLQLYSKDLEDYIATPLDPTDIVCGTQLFAEHKIVHALQEFCCASTSQILWVMGKTDRQYPSSSSGIAASIVNALDEGSVPTLHLFIDWPTTDESASISLLYSLIRQIVNLLPEEITARSDSIAQALSSLDGTLGSWETGMAIFETLCENMPPLLFLVVDGFEHLDFLTPGEQQVQDLLGLLNKQVLRSKGTNDDRGGPHNTFKILFSTAGNCASLNSLNEDALTILKTSENQNVRPGQWRAGRSQLLLGDGDG